MEKEVAKAARGNGHFQNAEIFRKIHLGIKASSWVIVCRYGYEWQNIWIPWMEEGPFQVPCCLLRCEEVGEAEEGMERGRRAAWKERGGTNESYTGY